MLRVLEYTPVNDPPPRNRDKMDQVKYELAAQEDHPRKESLERAKNVLSTIALLLVSGTISSVLGYFFYHLDTPGGTVVLINLRIRFLPNRHLEWRDIKGRTLLEGNLGTTFPQRVHHDIQNKNASFMKILWSNRAELYSDWWKAQDGIQCYKLSWSAPTCLHSVLEDCYSLKGARWYGGGTYRDQKWNIEELSIPMSPYLTGDLKNNVYGKILNRYWMSSNGIAIYIDPGSPLWVSINERQDGKLCLKAAFDRCPYWQADAHIPVHLNYTMCAGPNMTYVHHYMTQILFPYPKSRPSTETLDFIANPPSFLTPSSSLKSQIDASKLLHDSSNILINERNNSHSKVIISLDNIDFTGFSKNNETENITLPAYLIQQLHERGHEVVLAISPTNFVNRTLRAHRNVYRAILHATDSHTGPANIRWETTAYRLWNVIGNWFLNHVSRWKRNLGVSSFVFQAGHSLSLPFNDVLIKGLHVPDTFTGVYQSLALQIDSGAIFEATSRASNMSSFLMMRDRDWNWGTTNGLRSIIPEALTLSLTGCNLIMAPGMTFPNTANLNETFQLQLEDIYLHWLQIVALFPSLRFTTQPFLFGSNVTGIAQEVLAFRESFIPELMRLAQDQFKSILPIIRPIWWLAPKDINAQKIDDQFLIGNDLLVAPVIERQTWSRSIYLPPGEWFDVQRNNSALQGPLWIRDYITSPNRIPIFSKKKISLT